MTLSARFRGSERDLQTDIDRLRPLYRQLNLTIAGIESASNGLSRRLDEARTRAAALMGNEDGIYFEREPADEAGLVEAEAQMMDAYRRLEELRTQGSMLMAWREQIEGLGEASAMRSGGGPIALPARFLRVMRARAAGFRRFFRVFGWVLMLVIVYATLSGIEQRPSVARLVPDLERSLAFLVAAASFAIGYPGQRPLIFAVGLGTVASLELAQGWAPTRHGTFQNALVKAAGLGLGLLLVLGMERFKRSASVS